MLKAYSVSPEAFQVGYADVRECLPIVSVLNSQYFDVMAVPQLGCSQRFIGSGMDKLDAYAHLILTIRQKMDERPA